MRPTNSSMNSDASLVDLGQAQRLFDALPETYRLASLSPSYVAADAHRDPLLTPVFLVCRRGSGFLMHAVHEARVPHHDACDWQSAYGYGGPIVMDLEGVATVL